MTPATVPTLTADRAARLIPDLARIAGANTELWSPDLRDQVLRKGIEENPRLVARVHAEALDTLQIDPVSTLPDFADADLLFGILDTKINIVLDRAGRAWHANDICRALLSKGLHASAGHFGMEELRAILAVRDHAPRDLAPLPFDDLEEMSAICRSDG
ncbi:MAG: hypothetical protein WBG95_03055, partial [Sulfitobacter sp.]